MIKLVSFFLIVCTGKGIYIIAVGIEGHANHMNQTLLSLISATPDSESFWSLHEEDQVEAVAIEMVDTIAGASCLG